MKQKGTEKLTCFLRVSPSVKYRLDINSGTQSNNSYISQMMEYFEVSGVTPQQITKQPIVQIQKRIEDVVKILRSYERDYFKQVIDRDNKEEKINDIAFRNILNSASSNNRFLKTKRWCPMIMPGTRTNSNAWPNLSNTSSTPTGL